MIRAIIVVILRLALRIYFRCIEVNGLERVPLQTPVIFVLNHPNALVDPVFLLCLAPRRVSFLAKAPLFRMPVIGTFVRALDSLPVYRRQDEGEDITKNQETFVAARELLKKGGTIGICPEGVSHDEPGLRPIKTGAARIALAAVSTGEVRNLSVVPAGLYYTSKTSFRSSALLHFGEALLVEPSAMDESGNPARDSVRELSTKIENALRNVILDAEHEEALKTIARAERIFSAEPDGADDSLTDELNLQRRFNRAYGILQEQQPDRLHKLEVRMIRFEEELIQVGVEPDELSPPTSTFSVFSSIVRRSLMFLVSLGPAIVGAVAHFPAYRLGGYLAQKLSREAEDVVSTIKIISAMLLFPLTWIVIGAVVYGLFGWLAAVAAVIVIPLCGFVAIRFFEELDKSVGSLRALTFFLLRRRFFIRLLAERKAIRNEILALGRESPVASE